MTALPVPSDFQQPFTRDRQARFLETLSLGGNIRSAARHVGISPMTAYRWRRACAQFARGWDAALVVARAHAEEVLADRALNGVEETVFYHGEEVATRRRYDSRLLLAHLARLDAKAQDRNIADAAQDFEAVLEHFGRHGTLAAPDAGQGGDPAPGHDPAQPWLDESLPIVERALMFLDAQGGAEDEGDDPQPGAGWDALWGEEQGGDLGEAQGDDLGEPYAPPEIWP